MKIKIKYLLLAAPLLGGLAELTPQARAQGGVPLWTNRYSGPAHGNDSARAVAVDKSGNVFVTGYSWSGGDADSCDYSTVAYSSAGCHSWTNRYNGLGNGRDEARAVRWTTAALYS
jgi:hypothetical protein